MNVNVMNGIQERNQIHGVPVATTESTMLGKDDFLKLLIAQLQNQDPLDPMDDREFIAQMAQFSSLEQMTNMNAAMQKLSNQQESAALVQHSELIGKNVTYYREIEDANGFPQKVYDDNVVTSVRRSENGVIEVQVDSGRWISSSQITEVTPAEEAVNEEESP